MIYNVTDSPILYNGHIVPNVELQAICKCDLSQATIIYDTHAVVPQCNVHALVEFTAMGKHAAEGFEYKFGFFSLYIKTLPEVLDTQPTHIGLNLNLDVSSESFLKYSQLAILEVSKRIDVLHASGVDIQLFKCIVPINDGHGQYYLKVHDDVLVELATHYAMDELDEVSKIINTILY